jgi:hypothetical protein
LEQKQYNYVHEIDGAEYVVVVKERENARETLINKIKSVLIKDLSVEARSEGETL